MVQKAAEAREFRQLSTAIAVQQEGRRQLSLAKQQELNGDRVNARVSFQQATHTLKSAAKYMYSLHSEPNNQVATDLIEFSLIAANRGAALQLET